MASSGWTFLEPRVVAADVGAVATQSVEPRLAEAAHAARRRAIRVVCLTTAMVLMSLADLQITLTYLRSVGMGEMNPLARWVMDHGSPSLLVAWKCASVALAALVFVRFRTRISAETAAWFSCIVLVWLLLQWTTYADEAWRLTPALHAMPDADSAMWVQMISQP